MADRFRILLTNPIHRDAEALLAPHADLVTAPETAEATLRALATDVDGIVVRARLPDDILDHAPKLKGLVRHGVGLDFIPVAAATERGIPVANLPGSNTQAVVEYCFSAFFHLRRQLHTMDSRLRSDGWNVARGCADHVLEIGGSTIGIVGVGTIGRGVAEVARLGFGMQVLGSSRRPDSLPKEVQRAELETLFADSDAIVISCPLTEETRGLVGKHLIGRMKRDAILVNVSRGAVVDTSALVDALNTRSIGGAALDVFETQPLPPDHPLFGCPNLLLTPHVAGITASSLRNMSIGAAEEMLRILRGEDPVNLVNPTYRAI